MAAPAPDPGGRRCFPAVVALFVSSLLVSNIIAVKVAFFGDLPLVGPLFLPAAVIVFPISYIFGDVLTEVYGYASARRAIWIGFGCNLLMVAAVWVGGLLPAAPFWGATAGGPESLQRAYDAILGFTPRLLLASFTAYLVGEFLNAFVLARLKVATAGRWLWLRTISSTLVGQLADSGIFITVAFAGAIPSQALPGMIISQWLFKSTYETLATPLTYAAVSFLKRVDGSDAYDSGTDWNPLKLGG